jgi:4a-hydroxytetrahydrobiopterin dehydratase
MSDPTKPVPPAQLAADARLADWRHLLGALEACFETGSFNAGASFVQAVADIADTLDHHPDVDLRYGQVTVRTTSHDVGTVTSRDVDLAVRVSDAARAAGLDPRPETLSALEIGLDAADIPACRAFWQAVLGRSDVDGALVDPAGRQTPLWFQQMDAPRTQRGRFHLDLTVPPEVVEPRMSAALAAGGRLVTDAFAPSWWVLADPEGNEVCLCTWQARDADGAHDPALQD